MEEMNPKLGKQVWKTKGFKVVAFLTVLVFASASSFFVMSLVTWASGKSLETGRGGVLSSILLVGLDDGKDGTGQLPDAFVIVSSNQDEHVSIARDWTYSNIEPSKTLVEKYLNLEDCTLYCGLQGVYIYSLIGNKSSSKDAALDKLRQVVEAEYGHTNLALIVIGMDFAKSFLRCISPLQISVEKRIPIGGKSLNGQITEVRQYINPGFQELSGRDLFWYGRARFGSSNSERMSRQLALIQEIQSQRNSLHLTYCLMTSEGFLNHDLRPRDFFEVWSILN